MWMTFGLKCDVKFQIEPNRLRFEDCLVSKNEVRGISRLDFVGSIRPRSVIIKSCNTVNCALEM